MSCRNRFCTRNQKDDQGKKIALAILAGAAVIGAILATRPTASAYANGTLNSAANAVRREILSEVDADNMAVSLLDISLDSAAGRETIAKENSDLLNGMTNPPSRALFRYANKTEYLGAPMGRDLIKTVRDQYTNAPVPTVPDTMLANALRAAEDKFVDHLAKHPHSRLTLLIGSQGGVEDIEEAGKVADQLAKMGVNCVYFGGEAMVGSQATGRTNGLQLRTIESMKAALAPLARAGRLAVLTQHDFSSELGQTLQWLESPTPPTAGASTPKPNSTPPGSAQN